MFSLTHAERLTVLPYSFPHLIITPTLFFLSLFHVYFPSHISTFLYLHPHVWKFIQSVDSSSFSLIFTLSVHFPPSFLSLSLSLKPCIHFLPPLSYCPSVTCTINEHFSRSCCPHPSPSSSATSISSSHVTPELTGPITSSHLFPRLTWRPFTSCWGNGGRTDGEGGSRNQEKREL